MVGNDTAMEIEALLIAVILKLSFQLNSDRTMV